MEQIELWCDADKVALMSEEEKKKCITIAQAEEIYRKNRMN